MRTIFIAFLCLMPLLSFGQNPKDKEFKRIDSLYKIHLRSSPDSLIFYSQKLLNYSIEHNFLGGEKRAYNSLAMANSRLRNYPKSINYFHKALKLALMTNDKLLEHTVYNGLSINYRNTKFYDSSLYYSRQLLKHYELTKTPRELSQTYMNMGTTFMATNKLDSAQYYLKKSAERFGTIKNYNALSSNLSLLAEVNLQQGDTKKALEWADSSRVLAEGMQLKRSYTRVYGLLARIHNELGNSKDYDYYVAKEREFSPANIDNINVRRDAVNEKYDKSVYKYKKGVEDELVQDRAFYKSNIFLLLAISLVLIIILFLFYYRYKNDQKELKILRENIESRSESIKSSKPQSLVHLKNKVVVDTDDIQYIKSDGHYIEVFIDGKESPEVDRNSLTGILEILPSEVFVRIHKSFIVNITHIKIINSTKLMLKDGTWINLSRTYKKHLKEKLNIS